MIRPIALNPCDVWATTKTREIRGKGVTESVLALEETKIRENTSEEKM